MVAAIPVALSDREVAKANANRIVREKGRVILSVLYRVRTCVAPRHAVNNDKSSSLMKSLLPAGTGTGKLFTPDTNGVPLSKESYDGVGWRCSSVSRASCG